MTDQELQTALALERLHPDLGALFRTAHALIGQGLGRGDSYLLSIASRELTTGVVRALDAVIDPAVWGDDSPAETERHRASLARTIGLPSSDPMVTQWFAAHDAFNKGCHWGSPISPTSLVEHFRALSGILVGRLGPFFDIQDDLGRLAELEAPTETDAVRLRSLLLLPVQREHFFSKVTSPGWLFHLEALDAFNRLPRNPPAERWSELARWASWPEGQYLERIASERPDDVQRIVLGAPAESDNPLVWRRIVLTAMALPGTHAAAIAKELTRRAASFPVITIGSDALDLATRLLGVQSAEGMNLLTALLTLKRATGIEQVGLSEQSVWRTEREPFFDRIAGYVVDKLMERAGPAALAYDPLTFARRLRPRVRQAIELAVPEGSEPSTSKGWCRDFSGDDNERGVRATLLRLLAQALVHAVRAGHAREAEEVLRQMTEERHEAFTRATWYVLAEVGDQLPTLRSAAFADDRLLDVWWGSREAAHILRRQLSGAPIADQLVLRHAFDRGPSPSELAAALRWREVNEPSELDVELEVKNWQRTKLRWFRGDIPPVLAPLAIRLHVFGVVPTFEEQELAEDHSTSTIGGWVAPRTPVAAQSWSTWDLEQRHVYLRDWRLQEHSPFTDERSGLVQLVKQWAESEHQEALAFLHKYNSQIPRRVVVAIIEGFRVAIEGGKTVPLTFVDVSIRIITTPPDDGAEDARWGYQEADGLRGLLMLIKASADADRVSAYEIAPLFNALRSAAREPVLRQQTDVVLQETGFTRAQMNGWNALGGEFVQAVVSLGLHLFRTRPEAERGTPFEQHEHGVLVKQQLIPLLDQIVDAEGICGVAVRHQVGQYLPQLRLLNADWVEARVVPRFAAGIADPDADPIWPAYLVWSGLYDDLYRQWAVWYTQAAAMMPIALAAETSEHKPFEHLVLHLTIAYLRGLADLGDEGSGVMVAYKRAPASLLSHLYWRLQRDFDDSTDPPPAQILARLEHLLRWRVVELEAMTSEEERAKEAAALMWFVASRHVAPANALALGVKVVPWIIDDDTMLRLAWDRADHFVQEDASSALRLTTELLLAHARGTYRHVPEEIARKTCAKLRDLVDDAEWRALLEVVSDLARHGWSEVRSILP